MKHRLIRKLCICAVEDSDDASHVQPGGGFLWDSHCVGDSISHSAGRSRCPKTAPPPICRSRSEVLLWDTQRRDLSCFTCLVSQQLLWLLLFSNSLSDQKARPRSPIISAIHQGHLKLALTHTHTMRSYPYITSVPLFWLNFGNPTTILIMITLCLSFWVCLSSVVQLSVFMDDSEFTRKMFLFNKNINRSLLLCLARTQL